MKIKSIEMVDVYVNSFEVLEDKEIIKGNFILVCFSLMDCNI